jgi:aspartate 1-decarboxylase
MQKAILDAIAAPAGSGEVCLNGAAAHKGAPGDIVIVATFTQMDEAAARRHSPAVVYVDERNRQRTGFQLRQVV